MIAPLLPQRVRKIGGSFAFIEHRFLRDGFWASLERDELLLYIFLVMAANRKGLSYYGYDTICLLLKMDLDAYILARNGLIDKDLIAFDGRLFQVLSLPEHALQKEVLLTPEQMTQHDPVTVRRLIERSLNDANRS
jgi:hypothetical protein